MKKKINKIQGELYKLKTTILRSDDLDIKVVCDKIFKIEKLINELNIDNAKCKMAF